MSFWWRADYGSINIGGKLSGGKDGGNWNGGSRRFEINFGSLQMWKENGRKYKTSR